MVFNHKQFSGKKIIKVHEYHPYWNADGTKNADFDKNSGLILDLKDGKEAGISYFFDRINPLLNENVPICHVPSSNSQNKYSGIRKLAQQLAAANRIDATHCLDRHASIMKAAHGGDRNKEVHYDSIRVVNQNLIENNEVLLLDDITTTGNSLEACRDILIESGARRVVMLALGKTIRN